MDQRKVKLDPTIKHDTSRVKLSIATYNFETLDDDPTFSDDLEEADTLMKKFNMFKSEADSLKMSTILSVLNGRNNDINTREGFFKTFEGIVAAVNMNKELTRYDDVDYFLSYVIRKMKLNKNGIVVKPAVFFNNDDPTMKDIINIILIEFDPEIPIFYIMEKQGNNYHIRPIDNEEVLDKLSHYSNYVTDAYYENAAKKSKYKLF